ncbi:chemotaxis protein CheA [methane-oxidizing endosymbiont of Gigantopelta aegis]|uniref:chemotaxis protein CheA n=1 Tax=methane-oxidizing endosymbiont of Gigantopelta aegis TaxID=2794938 RepID=UPI001FDA0134|nr:chemotaxis protein CheA [methane-oxidizing endosymbiont of Gigantopelta aegis]
MAQFHQVFFEESLEGLDIMESGLLNLDKDNMDAETINTIFRAAHSIKGGSGTLGFTVLSDFTHLMETLLDEMRDGRRQVSHKAVNVLLGAVDCLREMLDAIQQGQVIDKHAVAEHKQQLQQELNTLNVSEITEPVTVINHPLVPQSQLESSSAQGWKIDFTPHRDMFRTGNDPVRILRELQELGELSIVLNLQELPDVYTMNPETCYLSWQLELKGAIDKALIEDIFDWVEDECDLSINALHPSSISAELDTPLLDENKTIFSPYSQKDTNTTTTVSSELFPQEPEKTVEKNIKSSSSIRVETGKIDALVNMVGELVITQSMLSLIGENFDLSKLDQLKNGLEQLERHTRILQENVMNIRMMPISFVFSRFPRLVHDLSTKMGKKIELIMKGEQTEVDKTVIEMIADPLVHLVRNSLDHGIEIPKQRIAAGKPATGTVILEAYHRGGNIVIEVKDDGKGLDKDILRAKAIEKGLIDEGTILTEKQTFELIFMPGFSTAEALSDISGRGVGMDVVRRNIQSLGGNIDIQSELGKGSTISIYLPLTLAILDGQSVAIGNECYIIPLSSIFESISISEEQVNRIVEQGETFRLRDEYIPIVRMHEVFNIPSAKARHISDGIVVVVEGQGVKCGLFVDDLLGQQQVVIKSLEQNYRKIEGISGATILGDGSVALILDIPGLIRLAQNKNA